MHYRLYKKLFPYFLTRCGHFTTLSALSGVKKMAIDRSPLPMLNLVKEKGVRAWNWEDFRELTYYINLVFRIFRICSIMSQFQFIYKTWHIHMGYDMDKNLTSHTFFPGKNWIRKFWEKSGFQIPNIFGQILRMDSIKYCFMLRYGIWFEIFTKFGTFVIQISMAIFQLFCIPKIQ